MNNNKAQYHGLPAIGVTGLQGESGQNGKNIYVGYPEDFFDKKKVRIYKYLNYGLYKYSSDLQNLYWNPFTEEYQSYDITDRRLYLDNYFNRKVRYASVKDTLYADNYKVVRKYINDLGKEDEYITWKKRDFEGEVTPESGNKPWLAGTVGAIELPPGQDYLDIFVPTTFKYKYGDGDIIYFINDEGFIYDMLIVKDEYRGKEYSYVYDQRLKRNPFDVEVTREINNRAVLFDNLSLINTNIKIESEEWNISGAITDNEIKKHIININRANIINNMFKNNYEGSLNLMSTDGNLIKFNSSNIKDLFNITYNIKTDTFNINAKNSGTRINHMFIPTNSLSNIEYDTNEDNYKTITNVIKNLNNNIINRIDDETYSLDIKVADFIDDLADIDITQINGWGVYVVEFESKNVLNHYASNDIEELLIHKIDLTQHKSDIRIEVVPYIVYRGKTYYTSKNFINTVYDKQKNYHYFKEIEFDTNVHIDPTSKNKDANDFNFFKITLVDPKTNDIKNIGVEAGSVMVNVFINAENINQFFIERELVLEDNKIKTNKIVKNWYTLTDIKFDKGNGNKLSFIMTYTDNVPGKYETIEEYYQNETINNNNLFTFDRTANLSFTLKPSKDEIETGLDKSSIYSYNILQPGFRDERTYIIPEIKTIQHLNEQTKLNKNTKTNQIKNKTTISFKKFNYNIWKSVADQINGKKVDDFKIALVVSNINYDKSESKLLNTITPDYHIKYYKEVYNEYNSVHAFRYDVSWTLKNVTKEIPLYVQQFGSYEVNPVNFNGNNWYDLNYISLYPMDNKRKLVKMSDLDKSFLCNLRIPDDFNTDLFEIIYNGIEDRPMKDEQLFSNKNTVLTFNAKDIIDNNIDIDTIIEFANPVPAEANVFYNIKEMYVYTDVDDEIKLLDKQIFTEPSSLIFTPHKAIEEVYKPKHFVEYEISPISSGVIKYVVSPLFLTAAPDEDDKVIKDITFNKRLFGSEKQVSLGIGLAGISKFVDDDLETRYRHYLPKLSGLQDNIKNLKVTFNENEYKTFIYDFTKLKFSEILNNSKKKAIKVFDALNEESENIYYSIQKINTYLKLMYNASMMLPHEGLVFYNDKRYKENQYNNYKLNRPLYTSSEITKELKSDDLFDNILEFNRIFELDNPMLSNMFERGIMGGNITPSGNGYLKLSTTRDYTEFENNDITAESLIELHDFAGNNLFSKVHNFYASEINGLKHTENTPDEGCLFRTLLWDVAWEVPTYINVNNKNYISKSSKLVNPYLYDINFGIIKDDTYFDIDAILNKFKDVGYNPIENYIEPIGFNKDMEPIFHDKMIEYIKDIHTVCKHIFGENYEDDIQDIYTKENITPNDRYKLETFIRFVDFKTQPYEKFSLVFNDLNINDLSNIELLNKGITERATTISMASLISLLEKNPDDSELIKLNNNAKDYDDHEIELRPDVVDPEDEDKTTYMDEFLTYYKGEQDLENSTTLFFASLFKYIYNELKPVKRLSDLGTIMFETNSVADYSDKFTVSPKIMYNTNNVYNVLMIQQPTIHNEYNDEFHKRFYKLSGKPKKRALPYRVD